MPVGRYAQEALTASSACGTSRKPGLVRAENVRVALTFVERGEAAAGVVYETDAAISPKVQGRRCVPGRQLMPVSYPAAIVAGKDTADTRGFLRFVESAEAHAIFRKYGFSIR